MGEEIGKEVGVDEILSEKLPEQKAKTIEVLRKQTECFFFLLTYIEDLQKRGDIVAMVGDGRCFFSFYEFLISLISLQESTTLQLSLVPMYVKMQEL